MISDRDLDQAREVADTIAQSPKAYDSGMRAVARVITSLPDEWVDADGLREALEWRDSKPSGDDYDVEFYNRLRDLLPVPRTMADTEWDDNFHPYMEALTVSGRRHILLAPMGYTEVSENTILVAEHDGGMPVLVPAKYLFPTGRYARLSMPEDT